MSTEENKAIVKEAWEKMTNDNNYDRLYDLYHKDYVYHGPGGYEVRGADGVKRFFIKARELMPDMHFTINDMIAEGDKVFIRYTAQVTSKTDGKHYTSVNMVLSRIADGKLIEERESIDRMATAQQGARGWFQKMMVNYIAKKVNRGMGFAE